MKHKKHKKMPTAEFWERHFRMLDDIDNEVKRDQLSTLCIIEGLIIVALVGCLVW